MRKAEAFRRANERPKPKSAKPKKKKLATADTSLPGVSATDKKKGKNHTAERNPSGAAGRRASFALEDSGTGRPSRKSTRSSSNRAKPDSNLARRQKRRTSSAKTRATRGK